MVVLLKYIIFVALFFKYKIMTRIAGLTAERTMGGRATAIRLDVRRHGENANLQKFFDDVGFEVEPINWTAKMKKSFAEAENGEVYSRSLEELLNV